MRLLTIAELVMLLWFHVPDASTITIPYPTFNTPVVHSGQFHILNCQGTYVILDKAKGMSIRMIGLAKSPVTVFDPSNAIIEDVRLQVSLVQGSKILELDQAYDPDAQLLIIAQGPDYAAARAFFRMCTPDGVTRGTGTLDIYVYQGKIFLAPSLYLDYESGGVAITKAGLSCCIQGMNATMKINGALIIPRGMSHFESFGADSSSFSVMVEAPARPVVKIGWLRNTYPYWLYLREIIVNNPETDEMYENWPPWITQRGRYLTWTPTVSSGLLANYLEKGLEGLSFLWVNKNPVDMPDGGYSIFNGLVGVFLDENPSKVNEYWYSYKHPVKPVVRSGDFRYYNEVEGVYEIDSQSGDIDATFDCTNETYDRQIFVWIWNLKGKNACEIKVNDKPVPFGLYNDGDIIEDPLVRIGRDGVKFATGPACFATVAFTARKASKTRLTMTRKPGIQFTYQMYSDLQTYEAWSDVCTDKPLFQLHIKRATLYHVTLPGRKDYAIYKLPLYWFSSLSNPATSMDNVRYFYIEKNGSQAIKFNFKSLVKNPLNHERECKKVLRKVSP